MRAMPKPASKQRSLLDFLGENSKNKGKTRNSSGNSSAVVRKRTSRPQSPDPSGEDLVDELEDSGDENNEVDSTELKRSTRISSLSPPKKRVKFLDISQQVKPISTELVNDAEPWIVKHAPRTTTGVAMHAKKLEEIRKILTEMVNGTSFTKILILTGPSGSSKTAAVKAIAYDLLGRGSLHNNDDSNDLHDTSGIIEWENPDKQQGISLPEAFGDFLSGVSFKTKSGKSLVLVEDIPNMAHHETKRLFNQSLVEWINSSKKKLPPLVVIFTEVPISTTRDLDTNYSYIADESLIAERIFSRSLLDDYRVKRIKVLPVNATLITKTLRSVVQQEPGVFTAMNKRAVEVAITSLKEMGDIRSSISALEFWARWRKRGSTLSIPSARESSLSLFHAVGRILYGTKTSKSKSKTFPKDNTEEVENDCMAVNTVLADWAPTNQDDSFNLALFENYLSAKSSQMDLDAISSCANLLSLATMANTTSLDISSEISCRGLRTAIRQSGIMAGSKPMFRQLMYLRERKALRKQMDASNEYNRYIRSTEQLTGHILRKQDAILLNGFFEPKIKKGINVPGGFIKRVGGVLGYELGALTEEPDEDEGDVASPQPVLTLNSDSPQGLTFSDDDIESD